MILYTHSDQSYLMIISKEVKIVKDVIACDVLPVAMYCICSANFAQLIYIYSDMRWERDIISTFLQCLAVSPRVALEH